MPPATYWIPNDRQKGYVTSTTENARIETQDSFELITQSGDHLIVNPNIVIPIESTQWARTEA